MQLNCPVIFMFFHATITLVACFVMFRVDLFVNSLFYCHHCWDTYAVYWCLWV